MLIKSNFVFAMISVFWPSIVFGQTTQELNWIVNTMARLCIIGGDQLSVRASGTGDVDLLLQSSTKDGKVQGEFQIDRSRSEGLMGGITGALNQLQTQEAAEMRRCLEPLRIRLLQVSLPVGLERNLKSREQPSLPGRQVGASSVEQTEVLRDNQRLETSTRFTSDAKPVFAYSPGNINESTDGFACRGKSMSMDFVICSFQEVYDINTQHAVAWFATMAKLDRAGKNALVRDQKTWMATMAGKCGLPTTEKPSRAQIISAATCVRDGILERVKYVRRYGES